MGKSSWVQKAALGCAMKSWHSITFIQQRLLLLPLWGKPADEENFVLGLAGSLQLDLTMLGQQGAAGAMDAVDEVDEVEGSRGERRLWMQWK